MVARPGRRRPAVGGGGRQLGARGPRRAAHSRRAGTLALRTVPGAAACSGDLSAARRAPQFVGPAPSPSGACGRVSKGRTPARVRRGGERARPADCGCRARRDAKAPRSAPPRCRGATLRPRAGRLRGGQRAVAQAARPALREPERAAAQLECRCPALQEDRSLARGESDLRDAETQAEGTNSGHPVQALRSWRGWGSSGRG